MPISFHSVSPTISKIHFQKLMTNILISDCSLSIDPAGLLRVASFSQINLSEKITFLLFTFLQYLMLRISHKSNYNKLGLSCAKLCYPLGIGWGIYVEAAYYTLQSLLN